MNLKRNTGVIFLVIGIGLLIRIAIVAYNQKPLDMTVLRVEKITVSGTSCYKVLTKSGYYVIDEYNNDEPKVGHKLEFEMEYQ